MRAKNEYLKIGKGEYLRLNNDPILWAMFNAIKKLHAQLEQEKHKNAELKQQVKTTLKSLNQTSTVRPANN